MSNKLNRNVSGAIGEHYVIAELLRRGFYADVLYSCAKDYDILAYNPNINKSFRIQVKAQQSKKTEWQIGKHEPIYDDNMFFVFVNFVGEENPEYYIVPSKVVHDKVEKRHDTLTKNGTIRSDVRKFKFEKDEEKKYRDWNIFLGL